MSNQLIVVAGAGGFIGGHLVKDLMRQGYSNVRAVDRKPLDDWWQLFPEVENLHLDLSSKESCFTALDGADEAYNLAADMGGMGFIENNKALCMLSVLINTHMLMAAKELGIKRFFYASSACVYAADKQKSEDVVPLKEADAYPAMPEDGYGWEKLFSERMCRHFREDFGLVTRFARYHNVYGPNGTWDGGREKAPAAICRKVIQAKLSGNREIEIWGDGHQTRSFMFIDDCLKGTQNIMHSDITEPLNLGSDELVTINGLVNIVEDIAGIELKRKYNLSAPKGVNGRNSDNTRIKQLLGWAPGIRLRDGLEKTYAWIHDQITSNRPCPQYSRLNPERRATWQSRLRAARVGTAFLPEREGIDRMTVDEIPQSQEKASVEQSGPAVSGRMLLVSIGLPPFPAAVSFVIDNLSREFTPQELLIAGQWSSGSAAYRRDPSLPQFRYIAKDWTWPKRGRRYVHWMRWLLVPLMVRRLGRLIREEKCNAVMGVFPDERFLLAAYLAAKRHKVPFYPYYHNTYRENREGLALRFATWLQTGTFNAAEVVFVMSEGMQCALEKIYPGVRFEPLVHTFSGEMPRFAPPPPLHEPLRLAFLGNLNESNLDAMGRFRQVANESPDVRLTLYSGSPQWFFEKVGICGPAIVHEKASDEELLDKLRSHDVLLLPHGFTGNFSRIEYETIFPTRTIPYLTAGRPILAHVPPDCFLTRWLRRHDCAEIVDVPDLKQVVRALDRLRNDEKRREQLVANGVKAAAQFYAPTVAGGLRRILRETLPAAHSKS